MILYVETDITASITMGRAVILVILYVETDITASITMGRAVILVILYVKTFKTGVIVFIGKVLTSHCSSKNGNKDCRIDTKN